MRVLAVNQMSTATTEEKPGLPSNVSLEVSKEDAQKLRLAAEGNGTLSLSLRSLHDKDDKSMAQPTGVPDLSRITPPSYYPVLYDHQAEYTPKVVDVFGKPTQDETEGAEEDMEFEMQGMDTSKDVTVVRGVEKETVGVNRP